MLGVKNDCNDFSVNYLSDLSIKKFLIITIKYIKNGYIFAIFISKL